MFGTLGIIQICNPPLTCGLCPTMSAVQDIEEKASCFVGLRKVEEARRAAGYRKWSTRARRGRIKRSCEMVRGVSSSRGQECKETKHCNDSPSQAVVESVSTGMAVGKVGWC